MAAPPPGRPPRRGGGHGGDDFSRYDDRYANDYAARDGDYEAWDGAESDADLLAEAGAGGFRRDHGYEGRARRYVDKKVYKRYSSSSQGYGWEGGQQGWSSSGESWGAGRGKVEKRVHRSHGEGYGHGGYDRFAGGEAGYGDHDRYADDESYAGGSRHFDERAGRYDYPRHERKVVAKKRYAGGYKASRYGHADDRLHDHGDYARYGHGGGYASSGYSASYGYSESSGHGRGHGYGGGGYRFHYDAGYAGRDERGYLTWPGKAG